MPINLIKFAAEKITELFAPVAEFFQPAIDMITSVADVIQGVIDRIVNFFSDMLDKIPGVGLARDAFGAVRGLFNRSKDEAETQESRVVETSRRTLEGEEKIAALRESNARDREKLENEEDGGERVRLRRRIRNRERVIAAEEAALTEQSQGETQAPAQPNVQAPDARLDRILTAAGSDTSHMADPSQGLEFKTALLDTTTTAFAEIRQGTPKILAVDVEQISSYNRSISAALEEIKTVTGGGSTVTNRDGTQTVVPPESTFRDTETVDKLNTTLNQLLSEMQEGNRINSKSLRAVKENRNTMW
jgi:hypothetical protein